MAADNAAGEPRSCCPFVSSRHLFFRVQQERTRYFGWRTAQKVRVSNDDDDDDDEAVLCGAAADRDASFAVVLIAVCREQGTSYRYRWGGVRSRGKIKILSPATFREKKNKVSTRFPDRVVRQVNGVKDTQATNV